MALAENSTTARVGSKIQREEIPIPMTTTENAEGVGRISRIELAQIPFNVMSTYRVWHHVGELLGAPVSDVLKYLWATKDSNGLSTVVFNDNSEPQSLRVFRDEIDGGWVVAEEDFDICEKDYDNCFSSIESAFEHACYEVDISNGSEITIEWFPRHSKS